jgi:hypothetical protein
VLKRTGNDLIQIVPELDTSEQLRNIWTLFPNKTYRLTKLYTLSPVRIPSTLALDTEMVTQADAAYRETR